MIAPTLAPPSMRALAAGAWAGCTGAHAGVLEGHLLALAPGWRVQTYDRGRSALAAALRVAMRATGRRQVVLPAYTSYSVAAAAAAANAEVVLADLDPDTLDFAPGELDRAVGAQTAAVVLGNLFGLPSAASLPTVRQSGALVIDDAAQALGATDASGHVGWRGDIGVLSFGRGKCVTTGDGGALLVRADSGLDELAQGEQPLGRRKSGWDAWALAVAVAVSRSPLLFGLLSRMPGANVGHSPYEPHVDGGRLARAADGLALDLSMAIERQRTARTAIAALWRSMLGDLRSVAQCTVAPSAAPAHLRYPVRVGSPAQRALHMRRLAEVGFAYVASYPATLSQLEPFRTRVVGGSWSQAERLASTLIALPCHTGVTPSAVARAARAMASVGNSGQLATVTPELKGI